jgi:hypothetical protein
MSTFPKIRIKQIESDELNEFVDGKIENKVDKVDGKGLSTNDFTNTYKTKLDGISNGANKVQGSDINGNILVDNTELNVYTHPGSGTNPHGTTAADLGLENVENKSSNDIRNEITVTNIENAIGETVESFHDKNYVFTQLSENNQWIIQHNLNKYCLVKIFDSNNDEVFADINYVDSNNIILTFSKAISGKAYLN